jgi:predicted DNA-binding protein
MALCLHRESVLTQEETMVTDPETHELLEPLRAFLETLSEELTEQKFLPALRGEIGHLREVFDNLSQSQETLERIAHGVERLRDVFAPAGTRLLTSVKEMEQQLSQHMAQLQGFAGDALTSMKQTHEDMARSLRTGTGLVQESAPAEGQALKAVDVSLLQPLEAKTHEFYEATRHALDVEWERIHAALSEGLSNLQESEDQRLERLSTILREIASGMGTQIRAEVEAILAPLCTRVQAVAEPVAESGPKGKGGVKGKPEKTYGGDELRGALSGVEGRLTQKLAEFRANWGSDSSKLREAVTTITTRLAEETHAQEKRMQGTLEAVTHSFARLEELTHQTGAASANSVREVTEQHRKESAKHEAAQKALFEKLETRIASAQEAVRAAIDKTTRENAALTKHIEKDFQAVQETLHTSFQTSQAEFSALLERVSGVWSKQWGDKFGEITAKLGGLEELRKHFSQLSDAYTKDSQSRDKKSEALQAGFQQVADGLAQVRVAQEASPRVVKEAVHQNYNETQERLRQVIDAGYDRFLQQISSVAQTVERYANLLESLHKSDELALNSISSDCKSLLKVAREEFDYLRSSEEAMKKIFPLLEKKLERQLGEIGGVRRVADNLEKSSQALSDALKQARSSLGELLQEQNVQTAELAERTVQGFREVATALSQVRADIEKLQESALATLQRELMDFTASKFEFMEKSLSDHQTVFKSDLLARLNEERRERRRSTNWLVGFVAFGVFLQLLIYYITHGPLVHLLP